MTVDGLARERVAVVAVVLVLLQVVLKFAGKSQVGLDVVLLGSAWILVELVQA
ncbi:MAG: hypothetical protein ACYC2H_10115 [Thermoplasmatota archaeon]